MLLLVLTLACSDKDGRTINHYEPPFTPVFTFADEALVLTGGYADPSVVSFGSRYAMYVSRTEGTENGTLVYSSPDLLTWSEDSTRLQAAADALDLREDQPLQRVVERHRSLRGRPGPARHQRRG